MKLPCRIIAAALLAAAVVSLALPDQRLAFGPEEGAVVWKRFEVEASAVLDDMEVFVNGEAQDPAMLGIDEDLEGTAGYVYELLDEYRAMGDGRPLELARTVEELTLRGETADSEPDVTEADELVGKTVLFVWDEDSETYECSFEDGSEDEEDSLAGLAEDTDLRVLLPDGPVAEDDEWAVEGAVLLGLALPGIDFARLVEDGEFEDMPESVADELRGAFESLTAKLTYMGGVEEDGTELQRIAIALEMAASVDVDPELITDGEEPEGMSMGEFVFELNLELEGFCLWDPGAGRFHSFELAGEGTATVSVEMTMEMMEQEIAMEGSAEFGIEVSIAARAEAR